jgi:hypothetical protein
MSALLVGYGRCSTDHKDLTAQRDRVTSKSWTAVSTMAMSLV